MITMVFTRFAEVGRVVMINYGADYGKLAVMVDILDQNRCLIDGPTTGVTRQLINFKRIALTPIVVTIRRTSKTATMCVAPPHFSQSPRMLPAAHAAVCAGRSGRRAAAGLPPRTQAVRVLTDVLGTGCLVFAQ